MHIGESRGFRKTMAGDLSACHAVVVPYPGQGHINPMMHLSKKLAFHGITVTFVLTESWRKAIVQAHGANGDSDAFTHACRLGLDIRPATIPDCVPGESERGANMKEFFVSLGHMETHVSELITNLSLSETPPTCLVADIMLRWAVPLSKKRRLQSVILCPTSATWFSIFYHRDLVRLEGSIDYIPGVPALQPTELPSAFNSALRHEVFQCFDFVGEADCIVANSFYALDCKAVEALRPKIPLFCVGPLFSSAYLEGSHSQDRNVGTSSRPETECTGWLGSKPPRSVIYVSFGSLMAMSRAQICELALGLMDSGHYFVWALRLDKDASHVSEMLPPGLLEKSKEKGFVAPWFSQLEVLAHPAVGGFLSHCGWNAVMESVSWGVPMLGFPLGVDQYTNCKLLVDEWKFGLRLRSLDDENKVIGRQEISRKVKMLMEGEEGVKMREVAERFRELAKEEVREGGLSAKNLETVVNGLKAGKPNEWAGRMVFAK